MFSLRSVATVGGLTLASRALGFLREVLIARLLGTSPVAEAFFVAMRLPNLFRQLFAEGAFNAAFVPMFARRLEEEGPEGGRRFAEGVLSVLLVVLVLLTLVAELVMPWLIIVFAPGFHRFPEKFGYAVLFTQLTFPYLLFMSLCALQGGILNAFGRFADAAAAPILLNVVMIIALFAVVPAIGHPGEVMSVAVVVAGVMQFLWLAFACHRAGMRLRLPFPRFTPDVRRMAKLMVPGLIGGGVNQINLAVATILATLQPQAVGYLYYSDRLYQLPLALIGSAIGVVLLPSLTRALRGHREEEAMRIFNRAIEMGFFLSLAATVALAVLALPLVTVLYQRGAFSAEDSIAVSRALTAISLGLPAYILNKALSPGFLAREDTMTPFRYAMIGVGTDIAISLTLFQFIGYVGIALGTAGAAWINCALLFFTLRRRGYLAFDSRFRRSFPRLLLSAAGLGVALWFGIKPLQAYLAEGEVIRLVALAVLVAGGLAVYLALVIATGAVPRQDLARLFRRSRPQES
ncbi:MAG TPA: murein biosynthesis integral membrane protein MurJ [Candidatus Cybelea sp.]|nr:murein biosynthesis integral membrane protein MurJ [Candidatus Cybelea sp.]